LNAVFPCARHIPLAASRGRLSSLSMTQGTQHLPDCLIAAAAPRLPSGSVPCFLMNRWQREKEKKGVARHVSRFRPAVLPVELPGSRDESQPNNPIVDHRKHFNWIGNKTMRPSPFVVGTSRKGWPNVLRLLVRLLVTRRGARGFDLSRVTHPIHCTHRTFTVLGCMDHRPSCETNPPGLRVERTSIVYLK
jgi:hypothetical protein